MNSGRAVGTPDQRSGDQSMSTSNANGNSSIGAVRHSSDDALEDREFQLLLEGAYELDQPYSIESRLLLLACGRLGLRIGEFIHMRESWVDWRRRMIEIPLHEPCRKGRDGGVCGYCEQLGRQMAAHNEDMSIEEAVRQRWRAKTDAAARSVPFDFDPRVGIALERFFDLVDHVTLSKSAANRRLDMCVEHVPELASANIYPHALRATAASYHASRGLDAISLQSLMGWSDLSTAHRYVRRSGDRTRKALQATHFR